MDKEQLQKMQEGRKRKIDSTVEISLLNKQISDLNQKGMFLYDWIRKNQINCFLKAFSGKSKASALKAKCIDCSCGEQKEITYCQVKSCPLWLYRPYQ